jgi:Tfp pilus assembly protein PilO
VGETPRLPFVIAHGRTLALVLAGVIAANVIVDLALVRRMVRVSGDREAILADRRTEVGATALGVAALEKTVSKIACTRADLRDVFERQLSSKDDRLTAILREVRKLAKDNRMDPQSLQFNAQDLRERGLVRFAISFPLEGTYATLREFIGQVEGSPNFLLIQDVLLDEQQSQGQNLRMQVRVETYFQDPDRTQLDRLTGGRMAAR